LFCAREHIPPINQLESGLMRTPREVSESYWAAECRRDIDGVMAHYQPDAMYQDAGGLLHGQAEIRGFYEASARDYPGLEVTITREFPGSATAAGEASALEVYAVLTDHAGQRFQIHGLNVMTVRDGKFTSVRCYEDPLSPEPSGGPAAS
jgi:ketosteroid isomerase-like protein